ncbi:unnamed protein product, partial [Medioppia subpectinata]
MMSRRTVLNYADGQHINDSTVNITVSEPIYLSAKSLSQNQSLLELTTSPNIGIAYYPNNSYTNKLMARVEKYLSKMFVSNIFGETYVFYSTGVRREEELTTILTDTIFEKTTDSPTQFALNFAASDHFGPNKGPKHLDYTITVYNKDIYNFDVYRSVNAFSDFDFLREYRFDSYVERGFCQLQLAVDLAHISLLTNTSVEDRVEIFEQLMPIPSLTKYQKDSYFWSSEHYYLIAFTVLIELLVMLSVVVKRVVEDKQTMITDYLFQLGVGKADHWISVVADAVSVLVPLIYLFAIEGRGAPVLAHLGLETLSCLLPNSALFWFFHICVGLERNSQYGPKWIHIFSSGYILDEMTLSHTKTYNSMFDSENQSIIHIKNLCKKYNTNFGFKSDYILKDIDLDVNEKSITVILGPNGSGKTTLVNIITGLLEFEGQITIGGHDICRESNLTRNMTGICPQENVYFKYLSIREHLVLFSSLKETLRQSNSGYTGEHLIRLLDMESDLNKEAMKLSGGTLRRLVLAVALIGPNDILLLDEPTASLDPIVRRKVWDLIIDSRNTKTVLITSHHLEEANLLSDQICIISKGSVCFNGSTFDMKREFNSGYHLKIAKNIEFQTENQITKIIEKFAKVNNLSKNYMKDTEELVYELNFEDSHRFSEMFDELYVNENELAISDISLGMTTLEGSYAKIVSKGDTKLLDQLINDNNNRQLNDDNNEGLIHELDNFQTHRQHSQLKLILCQIYGIFLKLLHKTPVHIKSEQIYGKNMKGFVASNEPTFIASYSQVLKSDGIAEIDVKSDTDWDIQQSLLQYSGNGIGISCSKISTLSSTEVLVRSEMCAKSTANCN